MRHLITKYRLIRIGWVMLGTFFSGLALLLTGWVSPPSFVPAGLLAGLPNRPYIVVQFSEKVSNRPAIVYPVMNLSRALQNSESYSANELNDASGAAQQFFDAYLDHYKDAGQDGAVVIDMAVGLRLQPSTENINKALRLLADSSVTPEEKRSLLYLVYTFHNQGAATADQKSIQSQVRELALNGDTALRATAVSTYSQLYEFHSSERGLLPPSDAIDLLLDAANKKVIGQQQLVFELSDAVMTAPPDRRAELITIVRESGDITAIEKATTSFAFLPDVARKQPSEVIALTLETLDQFRPTERDADGGPVDGKIGFDFREWIETYATYKSIQTGQKRERIVLDQLLDPHSHGADLLSYLGDPATFNRLVPVASPGELKNLVDRSRNFVSTAVSDSENRSFMLTMVEGNFNGVQQTPKR